MAKDFISVVIDSFGTFLETLLVGWYDSFIGPLFTAIATALGLPV